MSRRQLKAYLRTCLKVLSHLHAPTMIHNALDKFELAEDLAEENDETDDIDNDDVSITRKPQAVATGARHTRPSNATDN